jgi:predicted small secreted protein
MKRILFLAALLAGAISLSSCTTANGLIQSVERSLNRAVGALN